MKTDSGISPITAKARSTSEGLAFAIMGKKGEKMNKKVKALGEEWELVRIVGSTAVIEKDGKRVLISKDKIEEAPKEEKKTEKKAPKKKASKKASKK